MKKFSKLKTINKRNLKSVPKDKPVVYGIFTQKGRLQKVGRAKKGRAPIRIMESAREIRQSKREAKKFGIILAKSVEEAKKLETLLIKKRKPPFNKEKTGK